MVKTRIYETEVVLRLKSLEKADIYNLGDLVFNESEYPFYCAIAKSSNPTAKNVFLSAGIHGNEPAGVYALLEFLEKEADKYLADYNFIALPCLNPSGFEAGTRNNIAGINLNKNFKEPKRSQELVILDDFLKRQSTKFFFAMDLHEDNVDEPEDGFDLNANPREFDLYGTCPDGNDFSGRKIIRTLEQNGIPVCKREHIYKDRNDNGFVSLPNFADCGSFKEGTLQEYIQNYTNRAFITETPTSWDMEKRINTQIAALKIILEEF